jgi:cholesterol transport system auxiliary component
MNWHKKITVLLLFFPVLFSACFSLKQPSKKIAFYTLEYDPPQIRGLEPLPVVLGVERFSVAPTYNSNQIIYRDHSFKRDSYSYHRWRNDPGDLVTYFLGRDLQQSGLFKAVLCCDSSLPASHMVEGAVDEFFEWDLENKWNAVFTISITLMAADEPDTSKRILFQKTYAAKKACKHRNPQALAEAMSLAMKDVSREIIKDIHSHLSAAKR